MKGCVCVYSYSVCCRCLDLCCSSPWGSMWGRCQSPVWRTGHRWRAGLVESAQSQVHTGAPRWSPGSPISGGPQNRRHRLCSWSWRCSDRSDTGELQERQKKKKISAGELGICWVQDLNKKYQVLTRAGISCLKRYSETGPLIIWHPSTQLAFF